MDGRCQTGNQGELLVVVVVIVVRCYGASAGFLLA
jgi:hypothetical protein